MVYHGRCFSKSSRDASKTGRWIGPCASPRRRHPALDSLIEQIGGANCNRPSTRPRNGGGARYGLRRDRQLIRDQTYFVIEQRARSSCGGWSKRESLFGSDAARERDDALLDPGRHPAHRAFFVHPRHALHAVSARDPARVRRSHPEGAFRQWSWWLRSRVDSISRPATTEASVTKSRSSTV